jgi:hypothetical protein
MSKGGFVRDDAFFVGSSGLEHECDDEENQGSPEETEAKPTCGLLAFGSDAKASAKNNQEYAK